MFKNVVNNVVNNAVANIGLFLLLSLLALGCGDRVPLTDILIEHDSTESWTDKGSRKILGKLITCYEGIETTTENYQPIFNRNCIDRLLITGVDDNFVENFKTLHRAVLRGDSSIIYRSHAVEIEIFIPQEEGDGIIVAKQPIFSFDDPGVYFYIEGDPNIMDQFVKDETYRLMIMPTEVRDPTEDRYYYIVWCKYYWLID